MILIFLPKNNSHVQNQFRLNLYSLKNVKKFCCFSFFFTVCWGWYACTSAIFDVRVAMRVFDITLLRSKCAANRLRPSIGRGHLGHAQHISIGLDRTRFSSLISRIIEWFYRKGARAHAAFTRSADLVEWCRVYYHEIKMVFQEFSVRFANKKN